MSGDCNECGLTPDDGCPGPLDRCISSKSVAEDKRLIFRNGMETPELREEITKNWFRIRADFNAGRLDDPNHESDVGWILDYVDIVNERFNEARKYLPDDRDITDLNTDSLSEEDSWKVILQSERWERDLLRAACNLALEGNLEKSREITERACSFYWMAKRLRDLVFLDNERESRATHDTTIRVSLSNLMEKVDDLQGKVEEAKKDAFCGAVHPDAPMASRCDRLYGHKGDHRGRDPGPDCYSSENVYWKNEG